MQWYDSNMIATRYLHIRFQTTRTRI